MANPVAKIIGISQTETQWLHVDYEGGEGADFDSVEDIQNTINASLPTDNNIAKAALLSHILAYDPNIANPGTFVGLKCEIDPANLGTITND